MRRLNELWVPAIVIAYGVAYYLTTRDLPDESIAFPRFLTLLLLVLAVIVVATAIRGKWHADKESDAARSPMQILVGLRNPAIVFGTAVVYLALFAAFGFVIATIVYLLGAMLALRVRWLPAAAIAVGFAFGLYGVFGYLFEVPI